MVSIELKRRNILFGMLLLIILAFLYSGIWNLYLQFSGNVTVIQNIAIVSWIIVGFVIVFFGKIKSIYNGAITGIVSAIFAFGLIAIIYFPFAYIAYMFQENLGYENAIFQFINFLNTALGNINPLIIFPVGAGGIIGSFIYKKYMAPSPSLKKSV